MKWAEVRRMLSRHLQAQYIHGSKHAKWQVECDGNIIGYVLDPYSGGELTPRERHGVSKSLRISERDLRRLVSGEMSREEMCKIALSRALPQQPHTKGDPAAWIFR